MIEKYWDFIEAKALDMLTRCTGEYAEQIWHEIENDVVKDIFYCDTFVNGGGFTHEDLADAVGIRVLEKVLGKDCMTGNEYQEAALRTNPFKDTEETPCCALTNGVLGLTGEAGECAEIVKKHVFQGHELDEEHLARELGDVAWYLANTASAIGWKLDDIFRLNVEKLKARYPGEGFDAERSIHRAEHDI